MTQNPIHYTLKPAEPHAHLYEVSLTIKYPDKAGQILRLPNWIPGSYLIRDFAKNLVKIHAETLNGKKVEIKNLDKSSWQLSPIGESVCIFYQVYAWDLSVRSAHFDQTHAFFNGTSVFLSVEGQTEQPVSVELLESEVTQQNNWQVATTLPKAHLNENGFGFYQALNYKDLIEYPVEMGNFLSLNFVACGVPHRIVFTGKIERDKLNKDQLINDLISICETELNLMQVPYPFEEYLFQVMVVDNGYGGLEHTNSTALLCSRSDLPYLHQQQRSESYLQFLELCSHEYFHSWNVKRIKPLIYQQADLSEPVYTNQLWWFEGATSYYDGLLLNMAGILDSDQYLDSLSKEMTRVYRMPGRFNQSVADSSFLTWTKFYQQDENAPNAIISYYTKGALITLALDLRIRAETDNQKTLNDVLLALWQKYGLTNQGIKDGEIEDICSEVSGVDLNGFFKRYLFGIEDIPFEDLFAPFGIDFILRPAINATDKGGKASDENFPVQLGASLSNTQNQTVKVTHVWNGQTLEKAGLAAGDEIIALNGYKMTSTDIMTNFLKSFEIGDMVSCHFFRRDELMTTELYFQTLVSDRVVLDKNQNYQEALAWLNN